MLANVLLVVSVIVFLFACLCLLVPGLRLKSVLVWAVSVLLFWAAFALDAPPPPQVITAEQRQQNIDRQRRERAAELGISMNQVLELEARERAAAAEQQQADQERMRALQREPSADQRGGSMARQQMERMRGDLDDPIGPILEQMPSRAVLQRRQSGEDRIFTYTFGDGSRLILGARPSGNQTGLVLRYVDLED